MSKINKVTVYYPDDAEVMKELQNRYAKSLSRALVTSLPPKKIDELIAKSKRTIA